MKTLFLAAVLLAGTAQAQQLPQDARRTIEQVEYRTVICMEGAASQMLRMQAPQPVAVRFVVRQCAATYDIVLRSYGVTEAAARSHIGQMAERAVRYTSF